MRARSGRRGRGKPSAVIRLLGKRLGRRRRSLGLDLSALETVIGARAGTLAAVERGRGELSAAELYGLAAALDVSIDYFFETAAPTKQTKAARKAGIGDEEAESFVAVYWAIRNARARRSVLALVRAAAEEDLPV